MTETHRPTLWVFAGPNGAGKTSIFDELMRGQLPFINADEIARDLDPVSGGIDVLRAGRLAVRRRNTALEQGNSLSIETTLSGSSALNFMRSARSRGYQVNLAYVGIDSPELSAERVTQRVSKGGHDVPLDVIARRYPDSMSRLGKALKLAHRAFIFDNSGERRRLLLIIEEGIARRIDPDLPAWSQHAVPPEFRRFPAGSHPLSDDRKI